MIGILFGGAFGLLYAVCYKRISDYGDNLEREKKEKRLLEHSRKLQFDERSIRKFEPEERSITELKPDFGYSQAYFEREETKKRQVVIFNDCKFYFVEGER